MAETFYAMVTNPGLDEIAYCVSNSLKIDVFKVSVGDSSGAYYEPGGAITHFADNGSGGTTVTTITHKLGNGRTITIGGTTNYDSSVHGMYTISNVTATTFDINIPFVADDATGVWTVVDLLNETYPLSGSGGAVSSVYIHPDHANWIVIEGVVPAEVGSWWIRELGIWTSRAWNGDPPYNAYPPRTELFAVAKIPESYKPTLAYGSGKDFYIRIVLIVSNIDTINLVVDPSTVIATQSFVTGRAWWATSSDRIWMNGNVQFEPAVNYGDAVYWNPGTNMFGQAIADGTIKQRVKGFAYISGSNKWVVTHNEFDIGASILTPGLDYYLSTTTPGAITSTPPTRYTVKVGTAQTAAAIMVDIDDILSGYEDVAFTSINSSGDVVLSRDLTVTRDEVVGRNLSVANILRVGSEAVFPAFQVDNSGNVIVTGGSDSIWSLYHSATPILHVTATHILQILNNCITPNDGWRFEWSTGRLLSPNTHLWIQGADLSAPQGEGDISVTGGLDGYFGFFHGLIPGPTQVRVWGITPSHELTIHTNGFYYGTITDPNHLVNKAYVDAAIPGSYSYIFGDVTRGSSPGKDLQYYGSWTKINEIRTLRSGNFRITYGLYVNDGAQGWVRIYKNGVALGSVRTLTAPWGGSNSQFWTDDIAGWVANDLIQLYGYSFMGVGGTAQAMSLTFIVSADEDLVTLL